MTKEVKTGMMAFIVLVAAMAVFLFVRPKDWFDGNYFRMTASFSSVQGIKKGNALCRCPCGGSVQNFHGRK